MTSRQKRIAGWLAENHPFVVKAYSETEVTKKSVVDLLKRTGQIASSTYWKDVNVKAIMSVAKDFEQFDRLTASPKKRCPHCNKELP